LAQVVLLKLQSATILENMHRIDSFEEVPEEESICLPRSLPRSIRISFHSLTQKSACQLLVQALDTDGIVDFPIVTSVCEGVTADLEEMLAVTHLLSSTLQKCASSPEDSLALVSLQLKALTVTHELLYDASARQALVETPGLLGAIKRLHIKHIDETQVHGKDWLRTVQGPAAECVRLLTSEIRRTLDVKVSCRL